MIKLINRQKKKKKLLGLIDLRMRQKKNKLFDVFIKIEKEAKNKKEGHK